MADDAKTVLVVDDEPDAREFLTTVLEDNGYATVVAKDGTEAVSLLEANHPDLVTLDITMPDQTGVRTYLDIRNEPYSTPLGTVYSIRNADRITNSDAIRRVRAELRLA